MIGNRMTATLSQKEQELLNLLRENSRRTIADLAREVGVSRPTLANMLARLEELAIARYTVELKPSFAHAIIKAYVLLNRDPKKSSEIVKVLGRFPNVKYVCTLAGEFDVLIELQADRYEDLESILNDIAILDGVVRTQTYMVLADKYQQ